MPLKCRKCKDTGTITEWTKTLPFNPNSSDQVLALMRYHKVKVPNKRGADRETTEGKYLKRLGKRLPVLQHILDFRQRSKLISNYIWRTDDEDNIRTQFGFHPSTWRKSSRKPNLQVIPTRSQGYFCLQCNNKRPDGVYDKLCSCGGKFTTLAELVRATISAPPGYVITEADSEGIEAVLVAYAVGSPLMMKVCKAGPHGFFMSHTQGRPIDPKLPFPQLKQLCKAEKKRDSYLYDVHKRTIHGTHYGLTAYGMHDEYEEQFPTQAIANKYQQAYLSLWPELATWMARTRQQAYSQRYLDNHFNYRHYFYDVMHWDTKQGRYVLGDDGKRCIAFIPQSDGSAMQTEFVLNILDRAMAGDEKYTLLLSWLRLLVHDSLVFFSPASEANWVPQAVADVMNMPFRELGGLRIGVEVKQGENMRDQSTVTTSQVEWEDTQVPSVVAPMTTVTAAF